METQQRHPDSHAATKTSEFQDHSTNPADWSVLTGETPQTLMASWRQQRERVDVIAFYQDRQGNPWREFSNFYQRTNDSFEFVLPRQLLDIAGVSEDHRDQYAPVIHCDFSEKAIMLCKAAVMGDANSYAAIAAATTPKDAKLLGRTVGPWNDERWQQVVCGVAVAALRQKFAVPTLRKKLQSTGHMVLAEATRQDKVWAIGINLNMPTVYQVPARWRGSNILGWALMQVREVQRAEDQVHRGAGGDMHG